ncbi:MAG TPA: MarR family transcriptional regulator [Nocardioidaceae bacterium]|nr:MarR family transcriptional regulator [Nocardioidaceae bacterium]
MTSSKAESLRSIEAELRVLLRRVRRQSAANARSIHPELQPTAYAILLHVLEHEPARAAHIVEHLGIDKGAVSRGVATLERLGLIARAADPVDGRAYTLVVTDLGRERLRALDRERRAVFADRLASWTEPELAQFVERLRRYNASLES